MEDNQLISTLLYSGGALAAWLVAVVALGVFIGLQRHYRERTMGWLGPILMIGMGLGTLLSARNITDAEFEIASAGGVDSAAVTWCMRLATGLVLGICAARLVSVSQTHDARGRGSLPLFLGFVLFFVTHIVLNNLFGTRPLFDQRAMYPMLVIAAVYFTRHRDQNYLVNGIRDGSYFFMLGSIVTALVLPSIALQANYAGVIPKLDTRLWGLGSNPNAIGPLATVFLLLLVHRPYRNRLVQLFGYVLGLAVLAWSQSKTAWGGTLLAFAVLWYGRMRYAPSRILERGYPIRRFAGPIVISTAGLFVVGLMAFLYVFTNTFTTLANDEQVTSLTGRTAIWQVAIQTWQDSPFFGYGSSMWDADFRRAIDMDFAYNAHNQFLQTLSVAGAVGMLGLIVYTLLLLRYSYAANRATRGLSMALFALLIVRYFTEAPLNMTTIFSTEFVTHLLLFVLIQNKGRQRYPVVYPQPVYPLQQLQWR
jgi:O-antigen ligase